MENTYKNTLIDMSQAFFVILCPNIVKVINENNRENIKFLPFYLSTC